MHEYVPMNPQVYDFVLFRSTDIKDLQVSQAPEPIPEPVHPSQMHYGMEENNYYQQQQIPQQPYQHQQQHVPAPMQPAKLQFGTGRSPVVESTYAPQQPIQASQQPSLKFGSGPSFAPPPPAAPKQVSEPTVQKQAPIQPQKPHPATAANVMSLTPKADQKTEQQQQHHHIQKNAESPKVMTYSTGTKRQEFVVDKGQFASQSRGSYASIAGHGAPSHVASSAAGSNNATERQAPSALERPGKFRAPVQPTASFNEQFSMTQSTNAAHGKLSSAQEEVFRQLSGGTFYEKTSSFFDNISCEARDGKSGVQNERYRNWETFGMAAPPASGQPSYGHGRGGYRGGSSGGYRGGSVGRGRGGYRGGRGGSHSNQQQQQPPSSY